MRGAFKFRGVPARSVVMSRAGASLPAVGAPRLNPKRCREKGRHLLDRPLSRTMTNRGAFLTRRRWIRRPVKQLRKTVAARPVRRLDVAASAQLLIIVGRKGPGAALVSRSLPHEEAPCRRKANPRQATGAAASAPWRALMWLFGVPCRRTAALLEKGKPHAYHTCQRWNYHPDQRVHRPRWRSASVDRPVE